MNMQKSANKEHCDRESHHEAVTSTDRTSKILTGPIFLSAASLVNQYINNWMETLELYQNDKRQKNKSLHKSVYKDKPDRVCKDIFNHPNLCQNV